MSTTIDAAEPPTCESEPIRIPGSIQPHGALMVLRGSALCIEQVSLNTGDLLGIDPESMLHQPLDRFVDPASVEYLQHLLQDPDHSIGNPLNLSLRQGAQLALDAIVHRADGALIVELERVAASAPKSEAEHSRRLAAALGRLQRASDLDTLCAVVAEEVRQITGFDRVMLYQFDAEWNGKVVAEAKAEELIPYLGLYFPAADIPPQARDLYTVNLIRLIADATYRPVGLIGGDSLVPLDLTFSVLRSVSPLHLEYLKNMGVAASMSISLLREGKLWGLIACHHTAPRFLPYSVRQDCELLGQVASAQISSGQALGDYAYQRARTAMQGMFLAHIATAEHFEASLTGQVPTLLDFIDAGGAAIVLGDRCTTMGQTPDHGAVLELTEWLTTTMDGPTWWTHSLPALYEPARAWAAFGSGLLAVKITPERGGYILWFRPEVAATVTWAGRPDKEVHRRSDATAHLSPRLSFAAWEQVVRQQSARWTTPETQAALELAATITGVVSSEMERKRFEDALKESRERLRRQYKSIPIPVYSWRRQGDDFVLDDYNVAADLANEGRLGEARGNTAGNFFPVTASDILTDLERCFHDQRTIRRDIHGFRTSNGTQQDLAATYVFVAPDTVMVHTEDITAREALARSEKLRSLGQMAGGIAHDLNQSLMLVSSYSDLAHRALVEDPPNLADVAELLATSTQAAMDGGETVKRLLQFTRSAPAQQNQPVDLAKILVEAAQISAPRWRDATQAEGRPVNLHIEVVDQPTIQGVAFELRELLNNLIFNAVDALPSGGTIRLRVLAVAGEATLEITDTGQGMSPEIQARIFEPFYTTKGDKGTGLGLAMVFGIVERHGGRIEVRSAPGEGTTFFLTFPAVEAVVPVTAPVPVLQASESVDSLHVLVVDDEPMMTKAVMRMLRSSGHVLAAAGSGEEALQKLGEVTFDVVISDMGMGAGMNGWELAEAVKRRWPDIRFLLATGWGAAIDPIEARERGVAAILAKPYLPADLVRALAPADAER